MFLMVRHGQSTWNAEHRWAGQADPPLSELGRQQAAVLAGALAGTGIRRVVSSDLQRALVTAEIVAAGLGVDHVEIVAGLRERACGEWEGRTSEEIEAAYPGLLTRWRAGEIVESIPGEPVHEFGRRIDVALESLATTSGDTLIVAHAGVLRVLSLRFGMSLGVISNTSGVSFEMIDGSPSDIRVFDPGRTVLPATTVSRVSDDVAPIAHEVADHDGTDHEVADHDGTDHEAVDLDVVERELAAVEVALRRLSEGTYWNDEVTGEPIPGHVLDADPTARRA